MTDLEYRVQTTAMDAISKWRTLDDEMLWDYRAAGSKITFLEIRPVPQFVPGWYKYVGPGADEHESLIYFGRPPMGNDLTTFHLDHERYDVTPAE